MLRISFISALSDMLFAFVEGLLALRILLNFFNANPYTPFVVWVFQTSKPLLTPFEGIFPTATTRGGFVLEVSALFALLVYAFLGYIVREGLDELSSARAAKHKNK